MAKKTNGNAPTLKKDRLGGTPNTSTYKRSKRSISEELKGKRKKTLSQIKTRQKGMTLHSKRIKKAQVGKKK